jgi:hypothetical protein
MQEPFSFPDPLLDKREEDLLIRLNKDYENFIKPGPVARWTRKVGDVVVKITPQHLQKLSQDAIQAATDWEVIKKVLELATKGFGVINQQVCRLSACPDDIVKGYVKMGYCVPSFEHICALRSYVAEKNVSDNNLQHYALAVVEGAATGFPGLARVPFNLALSFLLFFRCTQGVALQYGYNVKDDPRELELAAQTTMGCLEPNLLSNTDFLGGLLGKMMLASEISALSRAMRKPFDVMAKSGGSELLYVQIRALANKAAQKALKKAKVKGIEAGIFKNMLEQIGRRLPKDFMKKGIPVIGAVIGAGVDTYLMHRVVTGSNMLYHKRFLFEKEARIGHLQ